MSKLKISCREAIRASNKFGSPIMGLIQDKDGNYLARGTSNPHKGKPVCAIGAILLANRMVDRYCPSKLDQEKLNEVENGFEGWNSHGGYRSPNLKPHQRERYLKVGQRLRTYSETSGQSYIRNPVG